MRTIVATAMLCGIALTTPQPAHAWGDEAHQIVALVAEHYLQPAVHDQVMALLATDTAGRYAAYKTGLEAGFLTLDEVRRKENLPALSARAPVGG